MQEEYAFPLPIQETNSRVSFGLFEADLEAGQLWKAGYRIKLQSQPFRLLTVLLERPGQVVSREELQTRLWGKNTTVDFDHSLGIAVNKIREALGDSADNPRFVETLARRGYRFIAPVTHLHPATADLATADLSAAETLPPPAEELPTVPIFAPPSPQQPPIPTPALQPPAPQNRTPWRLATLAALALFCLLAAAAWVALARRPATAPPHIVKVTQEGHFSPSLNNMESLTALTSDGVHLFAPVLDNGHAALAAISITGGAEAMLDIPPEIASPTLADISPDGSQLLLREHPSPESEQPLWVVPTLGGSARRVGSVLAHDATWMPDGSGILFANGNDLLLTRLTGNDPQLYASLPARAFSLRWEPNGRILRFTLIDPIAHTLTLWQLLPGDRKPHRILKDFTVPSSECCGIWTATGDAYVFQSSHGGSTDLWKLPGESTTNPVRLTDGPLQFESPVAARTGNRVYFLGVDARSELKRVTPTGELRPEHGFLSSAVRIDFSPDNKWVSWTNKDAELWRAKLDGTDLLQLTPDRLDVFLAHWSPDSSRLAVMAREPGRAWRMYLVGADGNNFQPLLTDAHNAADPSWSPDGRSLVFGGTNDVMGKESGARTLSLLNLQTKAVTEVPGSANLFSPRWSPDGRYIAALTLDQRSVRLFDVAHATWTTLAVRSAADPVWSSDSRFLFVHASLDPGQPIDRLAIPDGKVQEVIRLADSQSSDAIDYVFVGLTRDNTPLVRTRVFTGNIYYLDLK